MLILQPGLLAFYSAELVASAHSHSAVQLVLPVSGGSWQLNSSVETGAASLLIASGVAHELRATRCWVVLLERHSTAGKACAALLTGQSDKVLDAITPSPAVTPDGGMCLLKTVSGLLNVNEQAFNPTPSDPRLGELIARLDQCFDEECVKPEQWRATDIAYSLALSESRFLHLFREQMEIPWRPYLLWRRLLCALKGLRQGRSATVAAFDAGFSDSAHFSRTFRAYFGMTVREALAMANAAYDETVLRP